MVTKNASVLWKWERKRGNVMLQLILCDDDKQFLEEAYREISRYSEQSNYKIKINKFSCMEEISNYFISICDIAVLDVDFAGKTYTGIDIARKIRKERPGAVILFLTNYIEFAPEGYEVQAFRYLLKKDIKNKMNKYLREAIHHLDFSRKTIKIQAEGEIADLLVEDITYIESLQHQIQIWLHPQNTTIKARSYLCYGVLRNMEEELTPLGFLRIHKSFLVNMRRIKRFQCKELVLDDGTTLRVSERSYAEQKKKYLLWKGIQEWN